MFGRLKSMLGRGEASASGGVGLPMTGYQRVGGRAERNADPVGYYFDGGQLTPIKADSEGTQSFNAWMRTAGVNAPSALHADVDGYARAYMSCVWAFRAVNVRATKIASVLKRGRVVDDEGNVLERHPLMRGIEAGNRVYRQDLWERWAFSLAVFGEAYIEKVRADLFGTGQGLPVATRLLLASAMDMTIIGGHIHNFVYHDDEGSAHFRPDEIVYDRMPHPVNDLRGYSLIAAALDAVNIDRTLVLFESRYLANNARPGLIFTPKTSNLTETEIDLLKKTLTETIKGARNAGRPLLMPMPMDVQVVAPPPMDDFAMLTDEQKRRICSAVGVPTALVDYTDMAFQLSPEQNRTFYELTVFPAAEQITQIVDIDLLPFFDAGGGTRFELPISEIRDELTDPATKVSTAGAMLSGGAITLNEYRGRLGEESVDGGDVFFMPMGVQIVKKAELPTYTPPPNAGMGGFSPFGSMGGLPSGGGARVGVPMLNSMNSGMPYPALASGTKSVCAALLFENQPDLIGLQRKLQGYYSAIDVEWSDPAEFHVTLAYAPAADKKQIAGLRAALEAMTLPELRLNIGSLAAFDSVGQWALHFRIRSNEALKTFQGELYEACTGAGMGMSAYSDPDAYIPHVTMGYAAAKVKAVTFNSKLTIKPTTLILWADDDEVIRIPLGDDPLPPDDEDDEGEAAPTADPAAISARSPAQRSAADQEVITDEMATWRRYALKHGAAKGAGFTVTALDDSTAQRLTSALRTISGQGLTRDAERDAVAALFTIKADDEDDASGNVSSGATPEAYEAWWKDYDKLQAEIGAAWLESSLARGEETAMFVTEAGIADADAVADVVGEMLDSTQEAIVDAWVGTEDAPGPLAKLTLAGMAAGDAALRRANPVATMQPTKADEIVTLGVDWTLQAAEAMEFARTYAYSLIRGIDETTRLSMQRIVEQWLEKGGTLDELKLLIQPLFNDERRAQLIAQTESTRAYNEGAVQRWKQANVKRATWQTNNDSITCPICGSLHGKEAVLDVGWQSSKGIIKMAPAHPGCRCWAAPIVEDELVAFEDDEE